MKELENIWNTWNEAKRTAVNRVRWRATVAALCSTRNEEDLVSICKYIINSKYLFEIRKKNCQH